MKKSQKILSALTLLNMLVILLFPPFDDYSVTNHDIAIFGGFRFVLTHAVNAKVNFSLLYLEMAVVLVNAGILWLLTLEKSVGAGQRTFRFRKATLILIMVNLMVVMLFPPFEYISNMTRAALPTFEGFYFVFTVPPNRVIVTPILYLEAMFVLVNGGLLLLAFKENKAEMMTADQTMALMAKLQGMTKTRH